MVVAQNLKEVEIIEQDSLLLTRNLLRIVIFKIITGIFLENYFSVKNFDRKIRKLMPIDAESESLIDRMEKGVYDAFQKKYLKTLVFSICEAAVDGPIIDEYEFSINRTGNKKKGTFKSNTTTDITPNQMRSSASEMVQTLVELMQTLDQMPEGGTILMKLLCYDDVTPVDYEPPFFRCCSEQEANNPWMNKPLKMEFGNVNSKHFELALKVKSILDPCQDENNDMEDDEGISLGGDSIQTNDSSESDSEVSHSTKDDQYIVAAPAGKKRPHEDNDMADREDDTQDAEEDEHQLTRALYQAKDKPSRSFSFENVRKGTTLVAMKCKDAVILAADGYETRKEKGKIIRSDWKAQKISLVGHSLACAVGGWASGAEWVSEFVTKVVCSKEYKHKTSKSFRRRHSVLDVAKKAHEFSVLAEIKKDFTLLIVGYDWGKKRFQAPHIAIANNNDFWEVSEPYICLNSTESGAAKGMKLLEDNHNDDMEIGAAIRLARRVITLISREDERTGGIVRVCHVEKFWRRPKQVFWGPSVHVNTIWWRMQIRRSRKRRRY